MRITVGIDGNQADNRSLTNEISDHSVKPDARQRWRCIGTELRTRLADSMPMGRTVLGLPVQFSGLVIHGQDRQQVDRARAGYSHAFVRGTLK